MIGNRFKYGIIPLFLFLHMNGSCPAQETEEKITIGHYVTMQSKILGEERRLLVYLPHGYQETNKRYPVIYQLDGASRFLRGITAVNRLNSEQAMPEVIYVAVENRDRNRDMVPFETVYHSTAGGADVFLRFLTSELIPYIDEKYRTTDHRTLMGFSNSGQFVLYAFLQNTELIHAYVACSPSIAFNPDFYVERLTELTDSGAQLKKTVSIVIGGAEGKTYYGDQHYFDMQKCVRDFVRVLKKNPPQGLVWDLITIEGGLHVPAGSIYEGLKSVFQGWTPLRPPVVHPAGGYFCPGESEKVTLASGQGDIYYTLDGSEPSALSNRYAGPIKVQKELTIKAKVIEPSWGDSRFITADFSPSPMVKSSKTKEEMSPGIFYRYYEDFHLRSSLPDFKKMKVVSEGVTDQIDTRMRNRSEGYAIAYKGFIKIPATGQYTFYLISNDESKLLMDGRLIVHREPGYAHREKSGIISMEKGIHAIEIFYVGTPFHRRLEFEVLVAGPQMGKQELPIDMLYHIPMK